MTGKGDDEQLAFIAARAEEIRTGLDAGLTKEELQRPTGTRMVHALVAGVTAATSAKLRAILTRVEPLEEGGVRYRGIFQRELLLARRYGHAFRRSMGCLEGCSRGRRTRQRSSLVAARGEGQQANARQKRTGEKR
ncbi:hypothetical protein M728_001104 [Ensifer sp. WSM1721]